MTEAENMEVARQLAAQAWCELETEMIEMDVRLAEAFAKRIAALNTTIENLRASHDLPRLQDVAEINALRTRLAESEGEVGRLRGVQIVNDWDAAVRRAEAAEAEVGRLTEQDGAMLRNTMEALHAAEAERDDLLGALREIVDAVDVLAERAAEVGWIDKDQQVEARVDRARAAIAKAGGK